MLTKKDEELIKQAYKVRWIEWYKVNPLIDEAETNEGRRVLTMVRNLLANIENHYDDEY